VTLARAATDRFSGIRPADVPAFLAAQFAGAAAATAFCVWLERGETERLQESSAASDLGASRLAGER
jgi:glycerol uptake facilitator-like aquaporin